MTNLKIRILAWSFLAILPAAIFADSDLDWLVKESMLEQAKEISKMASGNGIQWAHPYALPRPREVVGKSSVWVLGYPGSVIAKPGASVIGTWADEDLWKNFHQIGIELLHTGPIHRAGGISGKKFTATTDGWFDPISLQIDPELGTEQDYRQLAAHAEEFGANLAGDLVPLHTGKGADFILALKNYQDYAGLYTMVEIPPAQWKILPSCCETGDSVAVPPAAIAHLTALKLLPGSIDSADAVKNALSLSGWDATGEVKGEDGVSRRWVYLHYFKPSQPTLNWLDPSNAAQRVLAGDIVKNIVDLHTVGLRLDAIPFLGIERMQDPKKSWSFEHPLSVDGGNYLASTARKYGGWTFQELNVPLDILRAYMQKGPDLSYDFFTRTETVDALLTGDANLLKRAYSELLENHIELVSLVHDLQNHDEITYQFANLVALGDKPIKFQGKTIVASALRERTIKVMQTKAVGSGDKPYNLLYRAKQDGLATTYAGFIAATLGVRDPYHATPAEVAEIKKGHLLLAFANAMQPGVFSLSSWDLVGALPLSRALIEDKLKDDDLRWVNRGGVDLLGKNPQATTSAFGLPRAAALYGSLPEQLKDSRSFVSYLQKMLAVRKRYGFHLGKLEAVIPLLSPDFRFCFLNSPPPKLMPLPPSILVAGRFRKISLFSLPLLRSLP